MKTRTEIPPAAALQPGWYGGKALYELCEMVGVDPWGEYAIYTLSRPWSGHKARSAVIITNGGLHVIPPDRL